MSWYVGEQHEHALLRRATPQALDGEADGVADGGLVAREADLALVEEVDHRIEVGREGGLEIGARSEEHQPHAVALPLAQELAGHGLDHGQAIDGVSAQVEVLGGHASREIERQHQIASPGFDQTWLAHPARLRAGDHQQEPGEDLRGECGAGARSAAARALRQPRDGPVEGDAQCLGAALGRGR